MSAQIDPAVKPRDYAWTGVHSTQVEICLPSIQSMLDDLLKSQWDWSEESLLEGLQNRSLQLWLLSRPGETPSMIVVTQINDPGKSCTCHIVGVAGDDRERFASFIPDVLEPWAKAQGCDYIQAFGRDGWERVREFKTQGWQKTAIVLRKALHAH